MYDNPELEHAIAAIDAMKATTADIDDLPDGAVKAFGALECHVMDIVEFDEWS